LYELTGGNYQVHRTVSYPEFPDSQLVFETEVKAVGKTEWSTKIAVSGTYNGPTDIASIRDYQLDWTTDGQSLSEKGSATLMTLTGKSVRSNWTSTIVPAKPQFERFPKGGEIVNVTFSPFKINGNEMSYDWHGTARASARQ